MRIKLLPKIIPLGIAIILFGCGEERDIAKQTIAQQTKKTLGETNESGCSSEEAKDSEECSENSSSTLILRELVRDKVETTGKIETHSKEEKGSSLRGQLNTLLDDMSQDEKKNSSTKDDLESLVSQVGKLMGKDSSTVTEGLESLVESYDKQENKESIKDALQNLVDGVESSKLKREDIESKLLSLVGDAESKKIKREEVEEKLLSLVGDAISSKKETKESLISLVESAEREGTTTAKRLASSIIEDVSQNKIKILRTEKTFVVIQVKTGDSLSTLAKKYYGNSSKYKIIYEANKEKIGKGNTIYPGTTLVIPKL